MLYLFYGDDDYAVLARAAEAQARHGDETLYPVQRLDGAGAPWGEVLAACHVLPFMAPAQVVRVDGLIGASGRRRSPSGDSLLKPGVSPETLAATVAALPETTVLILEEGGLAEGNAHVKRLAALDVPKEIRACPPLGGEARRAWIVSWCREGGVEIEPDASSLLASRTDGPSWAVLTALELLTSYVGPGGAIDVSAVEALIPPAEDDNVFHLSDAVAAGDAAQALTVLHTLLRGGMAEEQLLAILVGRCRDWSLLSAFRAQKVAENDAMRQLAWNAGKYRAAARGASRFARGELPRAYQVLVAADEALKSRPGDERPLILDVLVLSLAHRLEEAVLRGMFPVPL